MKPTTETYEQVLEEVCATTIAESALSVDHQRTFPAASIDALKSTHLLGAISSLESGGLGLGVGGAARIVRRVAQECASTAMVLTMHYCGAAVLEAHAPIEVRREAASGSHLSTLAFSESGSRSHFWVPVSSAEASNGLVVLNAFKSWVTSASHATAYVWSSRPLAADGLSTIWLVPASSAGMEVQGPFEGLGLRGNDSSPVRATNVVVPQSAMLGPDGKGFDIMMGIVLPTFAVLNAACSNGLMAGTLRRTALHASRVRHSDTGATLAELPTIRNYIARMAVKAAMSDALLWDTVAALESNRSDALLRVMQCKAAASETSDEVLDLAMRVCGGSAFRQEVAVERFFRDARAAGVMAPTTDVLYDFIGKLTCGMPAF